MQRLTEIALDRAAYGVFTRAEVACWVGGSADRQFGLLKRALASEEVVCIRRGLYCLAEKHWRRKADPLVLAQRVYGPSYVSLESALSYHGWIPEAVYAITSVSLDRSREFDTPLGRFSFTRIPQEALYAEVVRVEKEDGAGFFLASPLKALADYVCAHRCPWDSARPVLESLRVDENVLSVVEGASFDRLLANYTSSRVRRFLGGLRKDLRR